MHKPHTTLRQRLALAVAVSMLALGLASYTGFSSWAARRTTATPTTSLTSVPTTPIQTPTQLSATAQSQIAALQAAKQARTPEQKKINSQLLFAIKMDRNEPIANGVPTLEVGLKVDEKGRFDVNIRVDLSGSNLIELIDEVGGQVVEVLEAYQHIRAKIPAQRIEEIAALPEVRSIRPRIEPITQRLEVPSNPSHSEAAPQVAPATPNKRLPLQTAPGFAARAERVRQAVTAALAQQNQATQTSPTQNRTASPNSPNVGSKNSEGDATHRAVNARNTFGVSGAGVKIGVLSDGVLQLAASQALGDLGPVTVLPGQAGVPGDEGTAMLEIIHDLAPNAQLFFATAFTSAESFADNIRALRAAGCDIIVDDVFYFDESPFQEGQAPNIIGDSDGAIIAQAVIDVTNAGALYFSSAGNGGNKADGTSGVWEGDFVDGGLATGPLAGAGNVHNFGGSLFNTITQTSNRVFLFWSDPLGGSNNDYDLYLLNAAGTSVLGASDSVQDGTQDPVEGLTGTIANNSRVVVVKFSGADRFLHVDLLPNGAGRLAINTNGKTFGHATVNTTGMFGVAATPAQAPGPFPGPFVTTNKCETFSSDGPRKVFYNANSTAITPGNVLSSGGATRAKPDITAADGTSVTGVGGFPTPFFGTSAAAPHAGAIAALIKQANPALTAAQVRTILTTAVIDIEAAGYDNLAGFGIVDALTAVQAVNPTPQALLTLGTTTATEGAVKNGNNIVEPGETANLVAQILNTSAVNATNVQATLSLLNPTPGVTIIAGGPASYGNIAAGANASNTGSPFVIGISRNVTCGSTLSFALSVTLSGGTSPVLFNFNVAVGVKQPAITSVLDTTAPPAGNYTAITGVQTGRINRVSPASDCSALKTNPGLGANTTGARQFDAYTFTNASASTQCVSVTLTSSNSLNLYAPSYTSGGIVPANPSTNFLADRGSSSSAAATYSFNVSPGQQFTTAVHDVPVLANPSGSTYTLDVSLYSCATPPACTTNLSPATIPAAKTGTAYSQAFTATGVTPIVLALTGTLPNGVTFNPATGLLTGTPTQTGNFPFTVTATDAVGCVSSKNYTLAVNTLTLNLSDPAICLGPGGLVGVTFNVTNSSNAAQSVAATATLPGQLLALAGTCVANVGTCTVTNAATVTYTGNLAAGQTAVVSYQAQVADGTLPNTQLCINTEASIAGAAPVTVQACTTVNCPPFGPGLANPAAAQVSDQKPGSVLIFNLYTSSASAANTQNTRISLTNVDALRTAYVHLYFVDGASCSIADSVVCLTPNQTSTFFASDVDPGTSGYLVAVAQDRTGCPVNFNALIGDEFVKLSSGHAANLAAEAITALPGGFVPCDPNATTTTLNFDGKMYNALPRVLALSNIGSQADGNSTLLILNRIGGNLATGASTLVGVFGVLYDDAEAPFSFSFSPGTCQLRSIISNSFPRTVPRFEQVIPAGRSGWLKLGMQTDGAVLGAALNFNANAATTSNAFNQGHNLHKLTLTTTTTLTVPIFPPSC